ncbi:MAG: Ig-like domain-containing protein, partial [Candidatus Dojkabacteria bacterium]|nr:Ig-like domain-containing protein [Candidatus Dojkabacteria bacterium]
KIAGPGTVNRVDSFTNELLMTWDTKTVPDGEYEIRLSARDSADNKDSGSIDSNIVTVDNTGPTVFLTSPIDDFYTNTGSVLQTWDTLDTDIDKYEYRSCSNDPTTEECDLIYSTFRTTKSRTVSNQNIIFWWQVRGIDTLGNIGDWSDARKITMENITPTVDIIEPTGCIKGSVDIIASFEDTNPLEYTLSITNTSTSNKELLHTISSSSFVNTSIYTWDTTTAPDGEYEIVLAGKDKAGNTSTISSLVTVDNLSPTASVLGDLSFIIGSTAPRIISLSDNIELKEVCYTFDSTYICSLVSGTSSNWDVSSLINSLGIGNFIFSYYVLDQAGNQSDFDTLALDNQVHLSNITVNDIPEVQGAATTNTTIRRSSTSSLPEEDEELGNGEEELLAEDLLTTEEEKNDESGQVLAETDENDTAEKKGIPWWVYLLIISFILFIIIAIWRRKNKEEQTYR